MSKRLRPKITFANVVSCLALFVALGTGAYAATQLPKNSVGTKQLKKNAVNSAKVKNQSLLAEDFKSGQLPAGPQGTKGEKGDKGEPGATHVIARRSQQTGITTGTQSTESAECNTGETLVGGGAAFVEPGTDLYDFPARLHGSVPINANGKVVGDAGKAVGWRASATNETGATRNFVVIALCSSP